MISTFIAGLLFTGPARVTDHDPSVGLAGTRCCNDFVEANGKKFTRPWALIAAAPVWHFSFCVLCNWILNVQMEWRLNVGQSVYVDVYMWTHRLLTFRSKWTTLLRWRKATPVRICRTSRMTSSSVNASSSSSATHWLKISPPAALRDRDTERNCYLVQLFI